MEVELLSPVLIGTAIQLFITRSFVGHQRRYLNPPVGRCCLQ